MYELRYTDKAKEGVRLLKRSEPQAYKKLQALLLELLEHPTTGTGQIEPLKGNLAGYWSRRISKKHRLVYRVEEEQVLVVVVNTYNHDYTGE
ncbi:Txe/YoeB family addiction module toxin [Porphyromonas sp.]